MTTEVPISDWDNEVFVLDGGTNTFDEVEEKIDRYSIELLIDRPQVPRGSIQALDLMKILADALTRRAETTKDMVVSDLCPQLIGLEGFIVRVTDKHGDTREFRPEIWMSGGKPPVHVEVKHGARTLAHSEYETVTVVSRPQGR